MKSSVFAPWAEPVPDVPFPMGVADLARLPDDEWTYELVDGRLVRMPASGTEASEIAALLAHFLLTFVRPQKLGRVTGPDGTYNLTQPGDPHETALVPDVAFVRAGRLPPRGSPLAMKFAKLAPDLAAEVVSPSQYQPEMAAKAQLYLAKGVRLVWIVWIEKQKVDVWRPGSDAPITTLSASDTLDGLDVLPGFTLRIADLFM